MADGARGDAPTKVPSRREPVSGRTPQKPRVHLDAVPGVYVLTHVLTQERRVMTPGFQRGIAWNGDGYGAVLVGTPEACGDDVVLDWRCT
eukprot:5285890-Pyramimonas_sp.AAC.1